MSLEGYESEDSQHSGSGWTSSDESGEFVATNSGSPLQPGFAREDESEIRLFADILLNLNEVRVLQPPTSSVRLAASVSVAREKSAPVKITSLSGSDIQKKKRRRTSPEQLRVLESFFENNRMPSQATRTKLAEKLGMSSRRVQIWFQNKRAKLKRTAGGSNVSDAEMLQQLSLPGSPLSSSPSVPRFGMSSPNGSDEEYYSATQNMTFGGQQSYVAESLLAL